MAHLKKDSVSGHLLKTSTGHLSKTCLPDCEKCADGTPASIQVVFSGVTLCESCENIGSDCGQVTSGSVDGTYVLTYGAVCQWNGTVSVTVELWDSNADCPGTPDITIETFYIRLWKIGGRQWKLVVVSEPQDSLSDTDGCYLFYGIDSASYEDEDKCQSGFPTIDNDWTDCWPYIIHNNVAAGWMGYNGSATLSIP